MPEISICQRCRDYGFPYECEVGETVVVRGESGTAVNIKITGIDLQTGTVYRCTLGGKPIVEEIAAELKQKPIGTQLEETQRLCPAGNYLVSHSSVRIG